MKNRIDIFLIGLILIIFLAGIVSLKDTSHIKLEAGNLKLDIFATDNPVGPAMGSGLPLIDQGPL